jgi:hypothetical protein
VFDIYELYRQEFALFAWYRAGKITQEQYLAYMKPLDKAISELEMATLQGNQIFEKSIFTTFSETKTLESDCL